MTILEKSFFNQVGKAREMASDSERPTVFTLEMTCIDIPVKDGLLEFEVRWGKDTGWVYRDDIKWAVVKDRLIPFKPIRKRIEDIAKKNRNESEVPKAYHVRKTETHTFYYIKESDL